MTQQQGWTYEVHELSEGFSAIVYDEHGRALADHLTEEQARLIVAASDLLSALNEQIDECLDPDCEMCIRHSAIIARAGAA